jgi:hypothetical protein
MKRYCIGTLVIANFTCWAIVLYRADFKNIRPVWLSNRGPCRSYKLIWIELMPHFWGVAFWPRVAAALSKPYTACSVLVCHLWLPWKFHDIRYGVQPTYTCLAMVLYMPVFFNYTTTEQMLYCWWLCTLQISIQRLILPSLVYNNYEISKKRNGSWNCIENPIGIIHQTCGTPLLQSLGFRHCVLRKCYCKDHHGIHVFLFPC